jgi:hypothetical protein
MVASKRARWFGRVSIEREGVQQSSHRPSVIARSDPHDFPKPTGVVTLIGKTDGNSNFRKWHVGVGQKLLGPLNPALQDVAVR